MIAARFKYYLPASALLSTLVACTCVAETGRAVAPTLRVSRDALAGEREKTFACEQEVNDVVLGTTIQGQAKTTGAFVIAPCKEKHSHGLKIVVTGVSITKSEGRNGPAIIDSTTTTNFVATAPLQFDSKHGLVAGEVKVEAETNTKTDDIRSTQGGIAGAFVKRLAASKIEESRAESTAIARELAIKRIRKEVTDELTTRIHRINDCCDELLPVLAAVSAETVSPVTLLVHDGQLLVRLGTSVEESTTTLPPAAALAEIIMPSEAVDAAVGHRLARVTRPATTPVSVTQPVAATSAKALPIVERQEKWVIVRAEGLQQK